MQYGGTCPFLSHNQSLTELHSCLLPNSDPLHVLAADKQRLGHPAAYTCAASGKSSDWLGKMKQLKAQVEGQSQVHILAGFGGTLAGQSQDIKTFASSREIHAAFKASPVWGTVQQDLQGLTAEEPELAQLRGMIALLLTATIHTPDL